MTTNVCVEVLNNVRSLLQMNCLLENLNLGWTLRIYPGFYDEIFQTELNLEMCP